MFRTPIKVVKDNFAMSNQITDDKIRKETDTIPVSTPIRATLRKSIEEYESGGTQGKIPKPQPKPLALIFSPTKKAPSTETTRRQIAGKTCIGPLSPESSRSPPQTEKVTYKNRLTEASAIAQKASLQLGSSRYMKSEVKKEIQKAVDRLYQLVKEAEAANKAEVMEDDKKITKYKGTETEAVNMQESEHISRKQEEKKQKGDSEDLIRKLDEHARLIKENNEKMEDLKAKIEIHQVVLQGEKPSYASVAATKPGHLAPARTALHSVIITGKIENEKGEDILNRVRDVLNAKDGGIVVENIRKAKDSKIIIGCKTKEDRERVKERLKRAERYISVEDIKNKKPLVVIRSVLKRHSDEDIQYALKNQNKKIFEDLNEEEATVAPAYKMRAKNPQTHHVVLRVAPKLWRRLTEEGTVRIDLQTLPVVDQSPLVQCSLCLGFGHGRRLCTETVAKCSHCGGPHMRNECADWLSGLAPVCCNCQHAKMDKITHDAFSYECEVRRKWDRLARASVAYY